MEVLKTIYTQENLQSFKGKRARSGCLVRVTASFLCKIKNTKNKCSFADSMISQICAEQSKMG